MSIMRKKVPTLLLADDEQSFRDYLGSELDRAGFDVISAESGEQAYAICMKEDVDFIVSDISMPEFSGFRLLKKLRLAGKFNVPVIFITAFATHAEDAMTDLDNIEVISKPFEPKVLIDRIKEILEEKEELEEQAPQLRKAS